MNFSFKQPNGYTETIELGMRGVRGISRRMAFGSGMREADIARLKKEIETADAIVIGAGAGLSTAAGFRYGGERFRNYFYDLAEAYGLQDEYSGGFRMMQAEPEAMWAFWARNIYINRYVDPPKPLYNQLYELVKDKDYFVITTNVDHQFQRAGFDKKRLVYTQGDYGLFQSMDPADQKTYDNEDWDMEAMRAQGFVMNEDGVFVPPEDGKLLMRLPPELIPHTPDGSLVNMNLRSDDSFVEDEGWHRASAAYADFLRRHDGLHVLFFELGVGANTPVIIKYPFWAMAMKNENAVYACVNFGEAYCPVELEHRSILLDGDLAKVLEE